MLKTTSSISSKDRCRRISRDTRGTGDEPVNQGLDRLPGLIACVAGMLRAHCGRSFLFEHVAPSRPTPLRLNRLPSLLCPLSSVLFPRVSATVIPLLSFSFGTFWVNVLVLQRCSFIFPYPLIQYGAVVRPFYTIPSFPWLVLHCRQRDVEFSVFYFRVQGKRENGRCRDIDKNKNADRRKAKQAIQEKTSHQSHLKSIKSMGRRWQI